MPFVRRTLDTVKLTGIFSSALCFVILVRHKQVDECLLLLHSFVALGKPFPNVAAGPKRA